MFPHVFAEDWYTPDMGSSAWHLFRAVARTTVAGADDATFRVLRKELVHQELRFAHATFTGPGA